MGLLLVSIGNTLMHTSPVERSRALDRTHFVPLRLRQNRGRPTEMHDADAAHQVLSSSPIAFPNISAQP